MRGHAWWPAYLGNVFRSTKQASEVKYIVLFIGDPTRSHLAERYIRKFKDAFFQLAFIPKTKKMLKESITKACKMYCKLDPTFKSHVMNHFSEENDPENESSNYSVRGYRGGMRRRAGRGRGRGRSKSRSLSLQRSLTSLYSQSGCSYSWAVKKQLA